MKETKEAKETKKVKKTEKVEKEKGNNKEKATPGDLVFRCLIVVLIFFIAIIAYATYINL